jgi:hypothetical protein
MSGPGLSSHPACPCFPWWVLWGSGQDEFQSLEYFIPDSVGAPSISKTVAAGPSFL